MKWWAAVLLAAAAFVLGWGGGASSKEEEIAHLSAEASKNQQNLAYCVEFLREQGYAVKED